MSKVLEFLRNANIYTYFGIIFMSMGLWVGKNFLAHGDVISLINNWDDFNEYETNDCTCK